MLFSCNILSRWRINVCLLEWMLEWISWSRVHSERLMSDTFSHLNAICHWVFWSEMKHFAESENLALSLSARQQLESQNNEDAPQGNKCNLFSHDNWGNVTKIWNFGNKMSQMFSLLTLVFAKLTGRKQKKQQATNKQLTPNKRKIPANVSLLSHR